MSIDYKLTTPTFKAGDWVRYGDNIYQFIEPSSDWSYKQSLKTCSLWAPQPNEWCWFWNDGDELPLLGKFSKMDNNLFVSSNAYYLYDIPWCDTPETETKYDFEYCEPYPHPLPSSLQRLTNAHI